MAGLGQVVVLACVVAAAAAAAAGATEKEAAGAIIAPRSLPADVLRDFPGQCFASTACRVFKVGEQWPLFPFCGRSTCKESGGKLVEEVEDCPRPKPNPECKLVALEAPDPSVLYPDCCPTLQCPEGVQAEYYTREEADALSKQEAAAAEAAAIGGQGGAVSSGSA